MSPVVADGPDGQPRCWWSVGDAGYVRYHDDEWGFPVSEDTALFEMLCLEGFQAGLSWLTILRKRPAFRRAFSDFDIDIVAAYGDADVERLVGDAGIVRHRAKIVSTVNNARHAMSLRSEFGSLAGYVWQWGIDDGAPPSAAAGTEQSRALSRDLKRRGWSFVGPTTVYSFMQAVGLVNDHVVGCCRRTAASEARASFLRPRPVARPG